MGFPAFAEFVAQNDKHPLQSTDIDPIQITMFGIDINSNKHCRELHVHERVSNVCGVEEY